MKKVLSILFVLCCCLGTQALAQDTLNVASQEELAVVILDKIDHEVSLSEAQRKEVYAVLLERSEKFEQLKARRSMKKLTKASAKEPNERAYQKLRKVLTKEQYNRLQVLREETRKQKAKYPAAKVHQSEQDVVLDF